MTCQGSGLLSTEGYNVIAVAAVGYAPLSDNKGVGFPLPRQTQTSRSLALCGRSRALWPRPFCEAPVLISIQVL